MSRPAGPDRRQKGDRNRASLRSFRRSTTLVAALVLTVGLVPRASGAQEWHELYAAGQRALRNGQAERAAQLLKGAIQKRPQPGVAVPTYGTNFEPQYFPYLRLAEAYLRLEAYEDVLELMETSARFGVEPATERAVLESRARTALDAKRMPAPSVQLPPPGSQVAPPIPQPKSTVPATTPERDAVASPAETTRASPPVAPPRTSEPVRTGKPTLDLTTQPPGARVFVDDEPVGRSDPQTGRLRLTTLGQGRHRLRLSADGHDDLVREIVLASEPLSFHGVLSASRAATEAKAPQIAPAIPASPRAPWWLLWTVPAVLVPSIWLWQRMRLQNKPGVAAQLATPSTPAPAAPPTPVITERGSFEHLPVEFGEYRLLRRIGKGGMATVYEAERGAGGEKFALKRPLPGFLDDPRLLERFSHEAELGRSLHHPNIVRIVDRGQVDATPFFVMELIDGETLRERLDREGRLDPALATSVTARVAEALDYAHHKGVIHRDLKPTNIMLERLGGLKVMDYGIARAQFRAGLTTAGGFIGTPQYAAPEAAEGRTEPKSDVYSLGVVFFEMLTGSLPFPSENPYTALDSHRNTPPPTPSALNYSLTQAIDRIVLRLLSKEPSERPSAEELLNQLTDYQETVR
jgi:hypothetical protein